MTTQTPERVWIEPLTAVDPELALPLREYNALGRAGVTTVEDLLDLLRTPRHVVGLGERGIDRVTTALMAYVEHLGVRSHYNAHLVPAGASTSPKLAPQRQPAVVRPQPDKETTMTATISRTRWSAEDERSLKLAGDAAKPGELMGVFERVAAERDVSVSTVRGKYYALKKGTKSPRKASRKNARWSRNLEGRLVREVTAATPSERSSVFASWAQRRGVSESAIKAKFYSVRSRYADSASATQKSTAAASTAPVSTPKASAKPEPVVARAATDLSALTMAELASLGRCVSEEMERRVTELQKMWA